MKPVFILTIACLLILAAAPSFAQVPGCGAQPDGSYILCSGVPGIERVTGLADFIRQMFRFSLLIAGAVVFIRIVYGGIMWILGTTGGSIVQASEGRDIITKAFLGLALLLGSYLILYTINPDLVIIRDVQLGSPQFPDNIRAIQRNSAARIQEEFDQNINEGLIDQTEILEDASRTHEFLTEQLQELEAVVNRTPDQEQQLTTLKEQHVAATQSLDAAFREWRGRQLNYIQEQEGRLGVDPTKELQEIPRDNTELINLEKKRLELLKQPLPSVRSDSEAFTRYNQLLNDLDKTNRQISYFESVRGTFSRVLVRISPQFSGSSFQTPSGEYVTVTPNTYPNLLERRTSLLKQIDVLEGRSPYRKPGTENRRI